MSRRAAAAAAVGAVVGWLLAAPTAAAWGDYPSGQLPFAPDAWSGAYEWVYAGVGEPPGLSEYYFWGKFAFLMYVAGFIAVRALPRGSTRGARIGWWMLAAGMVAGLVGDLLGYWGGTGEELTELTGIGFVLLELPSLLLMTVGLGVAGVGLRHDLASGAGWAMLGGALAIPGFTFLFIGYLPHGVLVPVLATLCLALVVGDNRARVGDEGGRRLPSA